MSPLPYVAPRLLSAREVIGKIYDPGTRVHLSDIAARVVNPHAVTMLELDPPTREAVYGPFKDDRIVDISGIWPELNRVAREASTERLQVWEDELTLNVGFTWPLPLVSPAAVGLLGWYDIGAGHVAHVSEESPGMFLVQYLGVFDVGVVAASVVARIQVNDDGDYILGSEVQCTPETLLALQAMHAAGTLEAAMASGENDFVALAASRSILAAGILMANCIAQADPKVVKTRTLPPKLVKAQRRKGKHRPATTVTIDLPGLRYDNKTGRFHARLGGSVAWHMVRGHWRNLTADKWTHKKGQRVWVRPHSKGDAAAGVSHTGYTVH